MSKIIIFGNSGSGKSTLAKQLCAEDLNQEPLPHLDLDTLAWQATEPSSRKPLVESRSQVRQFINSNEHWVIEGCYTDLLELARDFATEAIFMDLPIELCVENARRRPWEPHKYESKQAQDANLDMLINWIKQYDQRDDTFSAKKHEAFYQSFQGEKRRVIQNRRFD